MAKQKLNIDQLFWVIFIFLILLAVCVIFTFSNSTDSSSITVDTKLVGDKAVTAPRPVMVSAAEIRKDIFDFTTKTFFEKNGDELKVWGINKCDEYGKCANSDEATNPTYAWAMLFLAQAKVEYKDSDPERYKISADLLEKVFLKWIYSADTSAERFSVHQLYEAGEVTNDDRFTYWVRDRLTLSILNSKNFIAQSLDSKTNVNNSYLLSTMARQLAQGLGARLSYDIRATNEDEKTKSTKIEKEDKFKAKEIERNERIYEVTALIDRILGIAQADSLQGLDSSYPPLLVKNEGVENLPQLACYSIWAKLSAIKLTSSKLISSNETIDLYKKETSNFFKQLLTNMQDGNVKFLVLQSILPCLHSIRDYYPIVIQDIIEGGEGKDRSEVEDLKQLYDLLVNYLLKSWDRIGSVCNKKGGFYSNFDDNIPFAFCSGKKSLVDNSWSYFILSQHQDLEAKRFSINDTIALAKEF